MPSLPRRAKPPLFSAVRRFFFDHHGLWRAADFVLADNTIGILKRRFGAAETGDSSWLIFFGVAIDLFSDGVMIGAGTTISSGLGLLLALGQVPADIPEGLATIAAFQRQGTTRTRRLLLAASFAVPILLGATIGYFGSAGSRSSTSWRCSPSRRAC